MSRFSHNYVKSEQRTDAEFVINLAKLSAIEYDRVRRQVAKELGIQTKTLDEAIKQEQAKSNGATSKKRQILFKEIEPWPEPVLVDELLSELVVIFRRFTVLPAYTDIAMALWVCFTWCIEAANTAPILAICSPEKRCGKTTVLSLLNLLVKKPLSTSNITPAALYRVIEEYHPTLLIDEADTFIRQSDDLRGILNSGHTRSTAFVLRTIGDNHAPAMFNTWGAKTIALIGKLPETLHDRSIVVQLKRKLPGEATERLHRTDYDFDIIKSKLARFANDYQTLIKTQPPTELPEMVPDRAADNWEAMLAIASLASKDLKALALDAAIALSSNASELKGDGVALLTDIKEIFSKRGSDRIFSSDLVSELCKDTEKLWASFRYGSAIDQRLLANLLKEFSIVSKNVRIGTLVQKGYELEQFIDSFARYIPDSAISSATALQMTENKTYEHVSQPLQNILNQLSATQNSAYSKYCSAVADKMPYIRENYENLQNQTTFIHSTDAEIHDYFLEERAAIMEFDGGVARREAEIATWGRIVTVA